MSFNPQAGIQTAGAAAALGANPFFSAGFGLLSAFGGGGGDRLPKISMERADLEADIQSFKIQSMSKKLGVHPMVLLGAGAGETSGGWIPGQDTRGGIGQAAMAAAQLIQDRKESNARIALLEAQAKAIKSTNYDPVKQQDVPSKVAMAAGLTADAPGALEETEPTKLPGGKVRKFPAEVNLVDIFKAPRTYSQEYVESTKGGALGEAFGAWKGLHEIADKWKSWFDRPYDFDKKLANLNRKFELLGLPFKAVLTRSGLKIMRFNSGRVQR